MLHVFKLSVVIICLLITQLCYSQSLAEQKSRLANYQKAISLVTTAVKKMGGATKTAAIQSLYMEWDGVKYMDGQSIDFNVPLVPLPVQTKLCIDFKRDRFYTENADRYLGGYLFHFRNVFDTTAFNFEVPKLRFSGITELNVATKAVTLQNLLRPLPNYLLKTAFEKKQSLRYNGLVTEKLVEHDMTSEIQYDVISFPVNANLTLDLYLDHATGLLSKYGYFTDHAIHGDQYITYVFSGYKDIDGVLFPGERKIFANDKLMRSEKLASIKLNSTLDEQNFSRPAGYRKAVVAERKFTEIGKNIFQLEGLYGYNPIVLNFKDHIAVIEPVSGSEEMIQMINAKFPGKPIKYVAMSHYHEDHTGGLPAFMRRGIPILAAKQDQNYLSHLNQSVHSVLPDELHIDQLKIQFTDSVKTVVADENLNMEIHQIGPNKHSKSMLAFYFPDEKILYQADMLISTDEGKISLPIISLNLELYKIIQDKKLIVENIFGVHMRPVTYSQLETAIKTQYSKN